MRLRRVRIVIATAAAYQLQVQLPTIGTYTLAAVRQPPGLFHLIVNSRSLYDAPCPLQGIITSPLCLAYAISSAVSVPCALRRRRAQCAQITSQRIMNMAALATLVRIVILPMKAPMMRLQ